MSKPIYIIKANGEREEFDSQKLRNSLGRADAEPQIINEIVNEIENSLKENTSTRDIYARAFELLEKKESPARARYSLRRAIMDLGPTGFPFEQFVAEIFKAKGFETELDVTIDGECADHEIDIVAWNEEKLIMTETKFHNQHGIKSDLKVALYVKARWDDLINLEFEGFGPTRRKIDEGWLITNTKFSESAIKYAKCKDMKLVGWNYPAQGNLQDLVEETRLHPITCLSNITKGEKKTLMEAGIVLCRQIKDNQDLARQAGLSDEKISRVLAEINIVGNTYT